jgi:dTDP-4-dehydro-6-deoxy-alpha-D-glucopyranose 2,3-dehydratase
MLETQVTRWLQSCRQLCDMQVEEIPWRQSREWDFNGHRFQHKSGGFFRVIGATVCFNGKRQNRFDQPLIDQTEIGILGFLIRRVGGKTEILVQAKPEPGNIGLVQAAPSVQATRSNYQRIHKGKETLFVEYFLGTRKATVLSDSIQSEQGTRFLSKFNRNMMVELPDGMSIPESSVFNWFPLQDLYPLLNQDFQVNTDARSVLTCGPWQALAPYNKPFARWRDQGGLGEALLRSYETPEEKSACPTREIIDRLHKLQSKAEFETSVLGLPDLANWEVTKSGIRSPIWKSLEVRHYKIESTVREVRQWDQPLMASREQGRAVLLCQEKDGVLHFLFNCRAEIGFRKCFEYGPTVQDLDGNSFILPALQEKEFELGDLIKKSTVLLSNLQSDEGGRFFRCTSKYSIHLLNQDEVIELDENLSWLTLRQIEHLAKQPDFFSNEARSLISMLLAYL